MRSSAATLLLVTATLAQEPSPVREPVPTGGWTYDARRATLSYQPTRHADRFSRAWLDVAAEARTSARARLHCDYSDAGKAGNCLSCHRLANTPDASTIAWRARTHAPRLEKFDHRPHLASGRRGDAACTACHGIDADGPSGVRPIEKSSCADCHNRERAGASCTQCHSYHIHDRGTAAEAAARWFLEE